MVDFSELVPVKFEIGKKTLTMPNLTSQNYARHHVIHLFEELQKKGYGVYTPGKRGPGNCAKFVPNDTCPLEYTIFATPKPTKKPKETAPPTPVPAGALESPIMCAAKKAPPAVKDPPTKPPKDAEETTANAQTLHSLWSLSRNLVKDSTSDFVGYECSVFANQILVLHRIRGGGHSSIDAAVKEVWLQVGNRIIFKECKNINKLQGVVSALSGVGMVVLCPVGCTCGESKKKLVKSEENENENE